ncbi:SOS response-associated peptidase [Actinacidiphila yeochonensis]|uniref:SOS response-associated peptidase n=1 Tax=Actinacidiphila yeochonensis TaxID=89050 RepID=UPI00056A9C53|nr:SOS response-associated peptidase [Actinacidiphila yeochonensis]
MCGRFAASRGPEELAGLFGVRQWNPEEALAPDWNVAPTKDVHVILDRPVRGSGSPHPVRQLRALRWGLVPQWARTPDTGPPLFNARAETAHEKPSFRSALATRRCVIPADGYFEWTTGAQERALEEQGLRKRTRKQPYFVTPADGSVLALAGLYEFWRDPALPAGHPRAWWATCAVVTTAAEEAPLADVAGLLPSQRRTGTGPPAPAPRSLADIHPRMPLVLTPDRWDAWLDPATTAPDAVRPLMEPPPPGVLRAHPVGSAVSSVRNNGPELVAELTAPEEETLF